MEFAESPPEVIRSVAHRWLLKHWNELRAGKPMPASKDLVADDLARLTDNLMFCDVLPNGGGPRLLIRYRGRRILETYGECDGKFLEDTLPAVSREATLAAYAEAADRGRPVYTIAETRDRDGKPVDFERLLLPFSHNGGVVDRILTALEWVSIEGGFHGRELLRSQPNAPRYSLRATIKAKP
jgi:hypothetical protein